MRRIIAVIALTFGLAATSVAATSLIIKNPVGGAGTVALADLGISIADATQRDFTAWRLERLKMSRSLDTALAAATLVWNDGTADRTYANWRELIAVSTVADGRVVLNDAADSTFFFRNDVPAQDCNVDVDGTVTAGGGIVLPAQTENTVFAGPTAAPAAVPTFRALVQADADEIINLADLADVDANGPDLGTQTDGNYVASVADGTGIDGTAAGEGTTYTPTLDLTEVNDMTWGNGTDAAIRLTFSLLGPGSSYIEFQDNDVLVSNLNAGTGLVTAGQVSAGLYGGPGTNGVFRLRSEDGAVDHSFLIQANGGMAADNGWFPPASAGAASQGVGISSVDGSGNGQLAYYNFAAGATANGAATTGDSATAFFAAGTLETTIGGTGLTSYVLGDILYSSVANTLARLAGNITAAKQFLTQTGTGAVSAAPAWAAILDADLPATIARETFKTIDASAGTDPVADTSSDTLQIIGTSPIVATGDAAADSVTFTLTQNAGTDVTADLEEETHAAEHSAAGGDAVSVENLATAGGAGTAPLSGGAGTLAMADVIVPTEIDTKAEMDGLMTDGYVLGDGANGGFFNDEMLIVGADVAEGVDNAGFVPGTGDINVKGDVGCEGTVYADVNVIVGASTTYGDGSINASGGTVSFNSDRITTVGDPVDAQDVATKAYVDAVASGLTPKDSMRAATTGALPAYTYAANVLTATLVGALPAQDGVTLVLNDRLLVKDESGANEKYNGLWYLSQVGDGLTQWKLTRTTDADTSAEVTAGLYTFVTEGTASADAGFVLTTNDPIVLNTTALAFTQFSGAGQIVAGNALSKTGNTLDVNVDGVTIEVNADALRLMAMSGDVATAAGSLVTTIQANAVALTADTTGNYAAGDAEAGNALTGDSATGFFSAGALETTIGGTGLTSYVLGGTIYASAANTLAALAGNITATKNFLVQTGTGAVSAAPAWGTIADADVPATLSRDTEAPAAGDVTGSLSAGYQVTNDSHDHTNLTGTTGLTWIIDSDNGGAVVGSAGLVINGTTDWLFGSNAAATGFEAWQGAGGTALALGRTTDTGASILSIVDGGVDNKPGMLGLYADDGTGYGIFAQTSGKPRWKSGTGSVDDETDGNAFVIGGDAAGGDLGGTYPSPSVTDDSHAHTGATISAVDDADLPAGITRDTEWDTAAEIQAATTDEDFAEADNAMVFTNKDYDTSGTGNDFTMIQYMPLTTGGANLVAGKPDRAADGVSLDFDGAADETAEWKVVEMPADWNSLYMMRIKIAFENLAADAGQTLWILSCDCEANDGALGDVYTVTETGYALNGIATIGDLSQGAFAAVDDQTNIAAGESCIFRLTRNADTDANNSDVRLRSVVVEYQVIK